MMDDSNLFKTVVKKDAYGFGRAKTFNSIRI